ncbi:MAG: PaaI family thioesterase [Syntrophaceae bacterium]|nr:PaaI family thioesterase [Syntrophaceae bacterium]
MSTLNKEFVAAVREKVNACGYFRLLGMQLINFEIGSSVIKLEAGEKHLQPFGVVHGGVLASIIDAAAFWAVFPEVDQGKGMTTVDLKINYLAPLREGKIVARGKIIKMGKTIGLGEGTVYDQFGKILAHGVSTLMVLPNQNQLDDGQLPEKFID